MLLFQQIPRQKANKRPDKNKPQVPKWRNENKFEPEPLVLNQPAYMPERCNATWDDDNFVAQYIDNDFLKIMVDKTNQTYVHSSGKTLALSLEELKVWIGMNCVMSAIQFPKIRMFWEKDYKISIISNAMTRDRFFAIRKSGSV